MTNDATTPESSRLRVASIRRLRLSIGLAVVITAVAVVALVKALGVSQGGYTLNEGPEIGFLVPHRTSPAAFSLRSVSGDRTSTLAGLEGRPLVLNLWATFCSVCAKETPAIASVARETEGRVRFVGIDTNEPASAGAGFLRSHNVGYLELSDPTAAVARAYGLADLPVTFFISPAGKLVGENLGALSRSSLEGDLRRLFGTEFAKA